MFEKDLIGIHGDIIAKKCVTIDGLEIYLALFPGDKPISASERILLKGIKNGKKNNKNNQQDW